MARGASSRPPPDRQDRIEAVAVRMATLVDFVIGDVSRP
jgi:hypothetical protein